VIVVDASTMTRALAYDGDPGAGARTELARDEHWTAPEHWRVEVFSAVRGLFLGGKLAESRARQAVAALGRLTVAPVAVTDLLDRMWALRGRVSGYDAAYVAAAELHGVPLVTADARLAGAGGLPCAVRLVA
jgi:predicted nucleic acid-binding protein